VKSVIPAKAGILSISFTFIILIILFVNLLRFWQLDNIPAGFHVNELGSAVTVQCLVERGCDAKGHAWPLFGAMNYGQDKPPTYIYPAMLWAKFFGSTVPSLRAYSVCVLLTGIAGLFFLGRLFFGNTCALAVVLAATCSPWAWVVTRLALESFGAPVLVIWALYFFWRSQAWGCWASAGFFLAAAMYAYPPARLQVPLLLLTLGIYEGRRQKISWPSVFGLAAAFGLALLPMAAQYLHGGLSRRFDQISIFNKDYLLVTHKSLADIPGIFLHNYFLHLSPDFLFFHGDPSFMYSTGHSGIFSALDNGALVIFMVLIVLATVNRAWKDNPVIKHKRWLLFLAANFFIGIIPSALTNQGLPHALRTCGSWPFMMLFTGLMWWSAVEATKGLWLALVLTGLLSAGVLTYQYFTVYPQESRTEFGSWAKSVAENLKTTQDWQKFLLVFNRQEYHCRYFLSHGLGLTCQQANQAWQQAHDYLAARGQH
jgi:hypothetical protein